jgi:hypothetical protein
MTTSNIVICTLIFVVIVAIFIYLKYFIPLRPKEIRFEYVYVKEDGTVNDLDEKEVEYLKTEFSPADGARPYIKNRYNQLTPDNKISGFISRNRVPKRIKINTLQNMQEERTISWIYLALAMASKTAPTNFHGISMIADGINHAVPTHQELQFALCWLLKNNLVTKNGNKYALTSKGENDYRTASEKTNTLLQTWDSMEEIIKSYV